MPRQASVGTTPVAPLSFGRVVGANVNVVGRIVVVDVVVVVVIVVVAIVEKEEEEEEEEKKL